MKIVHVNTSDLGGAGNAALRLHQGLTEKGIESAFLCLYKRKKGKNKVFQVPHTKPSFFLRVMNRVGVPLTQDYRNRKKLKDIQDEYEAFTFPVTDYDISEHPLLIESDVIHLHWISNFLDWPSFFSKIKKPVIWTFHDRNPFLGGFHLQVDKDRASQNLLKLDAELESIKQKSIKQFKNLNIVTPSKSLGNLSLKSKLFSNYPHHHIFNSIDIERYKILSKTKCRQTLGLPLNKKILLFISVNIKSYHKGFDLLLEAIHGVYSEDDLALCVVGENAPEVKGVEVISLGRLHDEEIINMLYNAADATLLPSREDNLPNVMLESMACGTPVISFPIGGMRDVIKPGINGILAEEVTASALKKAINFFMKNNNEFDREKIRKFASDHFSFDQQTRKYLDLYKQVLSNNSQKSPWLSA